nr:hypothetical protein ICEMyc226_00197 [Mycolicibacterium sp.]
MATAVSESATPRWTSIHDTFRSVVPGVDEIGTQPIPYARAGGRTKSTYGRSREYEHWSDMADKTIATLLEHPGAAESTLTRLIDVARSDVAAHRMARGRAPLPPAAAVGAVLARLDMMDWAVLSGRVWAAKPVPRQEIAEQIGVYEGWIGRHQPRIKARFAELLTEPAHRDAAQYISDVRRKLGPWAPQANAAAQLAAMGLPIGSETARVLLYAAGPYVTRGTWVENTGMGGRRAVADAVDRIFEADPAPTTAFVQQQLADLGVPANMLPSILETLSLKRFDDVIVRWGPYTATKIEAVLHAAGEPLTLADIVERINDPATTESDDESAEATVRDQLTSKSLFTRATRTKWALAQWELPVYRSAADDISRRIDAAGGQMLVTDLIETLIREDEITRSSARSYIYAPAFEIEDGIIRHRTGDEYRPRSHWSTIRGAFRRPDGALTVTRLITSEVLRGTSHPIGRPIATALGVVPGERTTFDTKHGPVLISWLLGTPGSPRIGSLRPMALALNATEGDTLALTFHPAQRTLSGARLRAGTSGLATLKQLLGLEQPTMADLASGLNCSLGAVVALLAKRGDTHMANAARRLQVLSAAVID